MNLMIVPGMFVCSSFLISVCMFIVLKALLISSVTVIVRTWVCLVCLLLCREEGSSPLSEITERSYMGLYEVPLFVSLLGFVIGTMLVNFHVWGIMFLLEQF